jgi:hypothetical protein
MDQLQQGIVDDNIDTGPVWCQTVSIVKASYAGGLNVENWWEIQIKKTVPEIDRNRFNFKVVPKGRLDFDD